MRRIGIYGGSFDPIHYGHLLLAESAREELRLETVYFVPARQSPLKKDQPGASEEERWTMLLLAIRENPFFKASRFELEQDPPSYTLRTIEHFRRLFPEDELWLIIGEDNLQDFPLWHHYEKILLAVKLGVGARPGYCRHIPEPLKVFKERICFFSNPLVEISSRELRERLKSGQSVRYRLPPAVWQYIKKENLYI